MPIHAARVTRLAAARHVTITEEDAEPAEKDNLI